MNIFQEITESQMIRQLSQLKGSKLSDLMESLFEHLLAMQVLAIENPRAAASYADTIVTNLNFPGFRQSQTDLYNLIVFVMYYDQYKDLIKKDIDVVLPELMLKRNLRSIASGRIDLMDYNHMMMTIQRRYSMIGGRQANLRREISDYSSLDLRDRKKVVDQLIILMRNTMNSDMYYLMSDLINRLR
jgi:hypothetical protein